MTTPDPPEPLSPARICVVGAGAVGGVVAGRLARARLRPVVVDADDAHVARMRDPGLVISGDGDDLPVRLDAFAPDEAPHADRGGYDLVLLAVRSEDTQRAIARIKDHLDPQGDVVCLQNGLNERQVANLVGVERTIGAAVGFGATHREPGRVELLSSGGIVIGRLDGVRDERIEGARQLLELAVPCQITDQIEAALWHKLVVSSMTALGALGGMTTGELLREPRRRRLARTVLAECTSVAVAADVGLSDVLSVDADLIASRGHGWEEELDRVLDVISEHFPEVRSKVLIDLQDGRHSEINGTVGEVLRQAEAFGMPVPVTARVGRLLREVDEGRARPQPQHLETLVDALEDT